MKISILVHHEQRGVELYTVLGLVLAFGGCWHDGDNDKEKLMNAKPFGYLDEVVQRYGGDEIQVRSTQDELISRLNRDDMAALAKAYREIEQNGDAAALSEYAAKDGVRPRRVLMLFFLFEGLARHGIEPFYSGSVRLVEKERQCDWEKLPDKLQYLVDPATKYGKYQFDAEVERFLETMTPTQEGELQLLSERVRADRKEIESFLDRFPMTKHEEAALVYFLLLILDVGDL